MQWWKGTYCTLRGLDQAIFLVSDSPIRNPFMAPNSAPECQTTQTLSQFSAPVNKKKKWNELANGKVGRCYKWYPSCSSLMYVQCWFFNITVDNFIFAYNFLLIN